MSMQCSYGKNSILDFMHFMLKKIFMKEEKFTTSQ